jgi:DNA-binding PadR family transcriptional regulator
MLAAGLIEESDERPDPSMDDERRRYYRLCPNGQSVLAEECQRLNEAVKVARVKQVLVCG